MNELVQPPGQQQLVPPAPSRSASSWRVITLTPAGVRSSLPHRDLVAAAGGAADAAARYGEAWIVAADGSSLHVPSTGPCSPRPGWPVLAARVITQRKASIP